MDFSENFILDNSVPIDAEFEVFRKLSIDVCVWGIQERRNQDSKLSEENAADVLLSFSSSFVYRLSVAIVLAKRPL